MRGGVKWVTIGAGVSFSLVHVHPTAFANIDLGQIGRSIGPLAFCSLYWWAGRDMAYAVGGVGMLCVCTVVFGALKAPQKSLQ